MHKVAICAIASGPSAEKKGLTERAEKNGESLWIFSPPRRTAEPPWDRLANRTWDPSQKPSNYIGNRNNFNLTEPLPKLGDEKK
jgi:hypothetical protein